MSHRDGGAASSEQLEQVVREVGPLVDDGFRRLRLGRIPTAVNQHFWSQAEHRTLGEPRGGYDLTLRTYPKTVPIPKTADKDLIEGHDALVQIRFDGLFADTDRSFIRVLYGIANTALEGAEPRYVARRDLVNHYAYTFTTIDTRGKDPDEPLSDGLTADGLQGAFRILGPHSDFSAIELADAIKVAHAGENLSDEETARIVVDQAEQELVATMDQELRPLGISVSEAVALRGMLRRLQEPQTR